MEATVTKTTTEQGATHNTETGRTKIPDSHGGVSEEVRQKVTEMFGANVLIMSKDVYEKVVASVGAQAEDAKANGFKYEPRLTERFTNLAKRNLNPLTLLVAVAVGGGIYWVAKKGGQYLARRMGWNLFGNIVLMDSSVQGEEIGRLRQPARAPRHIAPPSPIATA